MFSYSFIIPQTAFKVNKNQHIFYGFYVVFCLDFIFWFVVFVLTFSWLSQIHLPYYKQDKQCFLYAAPHFQYSRQQTISLGSGGSYVSFRYTHPFHCQRAWHKLYNFRYGKVSRKKRSETSGNFRPRSRYSCFRNIFLFQKSSILSQKAVQRGYPLWSWAGYPECRRTDWSFRWTSE